MTSNFKCLTFSTLPSSSLWRIVNIFLLLKKQYNAREPQVRPRETLLQVPLSISPFSKVLEKNKAPGSLIEDLPQTRPQASQVVSTH